MCTGGFFPGGKEAGA